MFKGLINFLSLSKRVHELEEVVSNLEYKENCRSRDIRFKKVKKLLKSKGYKV